MKIRFPFASPTALFCLAFAGAIAWSSISSDTNSVDEPAARSEIVSDHIRNNPAGDAITLALAEYISDHWKIPQESSAVLVGRAFVAARDFALDPLLVLAVMAQESSFRNFGNAHAWLRTPAAAVNPLAAHGPMQVAGRWHPEKMPRDEGGRIRPTTIDENVHVGAWVLREYLDREQGDVHTALQRYNGNRADPHGRYASSVMRHLEDLERALGAHAPSGRRVHVAHN